MTSLPGSVLVSTLTFFLKGGKVNIKVTYIDNIKLFMFFKSSAYFIDPLKNLKMVPDYVANETEF